MVVRAILLKQTAAATRSGICLCLNGVIKNNRQKCNCLSYMKSDLHSYNTGHYFSTAARFLGWAATVFALFQVVDGSVAAYFILPAGIITQFCYYRTEFDLLNRTYREGVRLFGITFGKVKPLPGVDFLYLNKNNYSQLAESRASMTQFRGVKFDGYIRLADDTKLHLVQEHTKEKALQQLEKISDDLGIELRDQTEMKH